MQKFEFLRQPLLGKLAMSPERKKERKREKISAHADGGPRSPSAHAGLFARPPISMSGNFLAHVSAESPSNISPNPSEVISEVSEP